MNKYLFHEVANIIYHFVWHTYCDWYIELSKISLQKNSEESQETKDVLIWSYIEILKLIHPIMPFISEKLWEKIYGSKEFLMNQKFCSFNINKTYNDSQLNIKNLILIITSIRNLRSELNIPYKKLIDLNIYNNNKNFMNFIKNYSHELLKILKLNNLSFNSINNKIKGSAYVIVADTTLLIPLENIVNTQNELEKLKKKKENEKVNLDKIEKKLSNSSFLNKAPISIKNKFEKESTEIKSSIDKIDEIISIIS